MSTVHRTAAGRRIVGGLLALAATLLAGAGRAAMPDYALLDEVLLQNVRNGYVDYDGIAAHPKFAPFLAQLAGPHDAFASREAETAYYINAYNAFAIRGILDGHSPATRFGRHRYFKSLEFRLGGEDLTLEDIERRRLRPLGDARVHFAIACASLSCPRLANSAWRPETLDARLEQATRAFVNDVSRNRFDIAQRVVFASAIFDWFSEDFEKAAGSLPAYLARYADDPAVRAALLEGRLAVRHLPYDWDLNGSLAHDDRD